MKVHAVPKQLTDKEELAKVTQETIALSKKNDKELTEEEKLAVRNAEKLNVQNFPLIFPMRATIGFMIRNMDGRNQQAIEFIRAILPQTAGHVSMLVHLVNDYDKLDEDSKNRVDCLDWLARRNKVTVQRFLDALAEGITWSYTNMTKVIIASKKPDLAEKIFKSAENESLKSSQHKKLAAQVAGLISDKPLVQVDTGDKSIHHGDVNNTVVLSFSDYTKQNDKLIRGPNVVDRKDYVDGEVVND